MRLVLLAVMLPLAATLTAQMPSPSPRPVAIAKAPARATTGAPAPAATRRLPGTNAFHTVFNRNASARSDGNAYLLMYLSAVIYPELLDKLTRVDLDDDQLNASPKRFETKYRQLTKHLFFDPAAAPSETNREPTFEFVTFSESGGYDPEAMLIDTPDVIYVVFRGTDRVAAAKSAFGYGANEWLKTDFDFLGTAPGEGMRGKVHEGFWQSLAKIRNRLADRILALGGKTDKKVWITGHSLGAGHAQLFGAWLAIKHAVPVQGVYAFAAPQVGDKLFTDDVNAAFWQHKMQCFDFVDDPITMLALYVAGYARCGTRNYYDDLDSFSFAAKERPVTDALKLLPSVLGVALNQLEGAINKGKKVRFNLAGSEFCYHYQTWYLTAAYKQLSKAQRQLCPPALGIPRTSDSACSLGIVSRGKSSRLEDQVGDVVGAGVKAVVDVIENVEFNVKSLLDNVAGTAITEGTYYVRCNKGGRALRWKAPMDDGAPIQLWDKESTGAEKWTIRRDGALGYTVSSGGRFLDLAAEDLFDNGGKVQMWEANGLFGGHMPNQHWLFYRIRGNKYAIVNVASGKLLDAKDGELARNGGGVVQQSGISNDQSQVWILEKAD